MRQIGQQFVEFAQGTGVQRRVQPLTELLGGQPALGVMLLQQGRNLVPVGVRGPDPRRV
jgi:hypothetical protein